MSSVAKAVPKFFKITQLKSTIAMPAKKKNTMRSIGLRKRHQTVYLDITPQIAGSLAGVKELVKIELAETKKSREQMRLERKSDPGFVIEKRHAGKN
ncbi:unnamed protein product [Ambrosiozyma monospora]|uniref:Unnamed protein product n=1 Tax=Ambrosiozyma monospora TaxID=43982 RepID=A0ACB5SR69_AMBMO|nr:unnamed protein product [Ambrosiozyma monospora]